MSGSVEGEEQPDSWPDGRPAESPPRWPLWYGPAAFLTVFVLVGLFATVLVATTGGSSDDPASGTTLIATLVQNAALVAVALGFAALTAPPRPWHFGLRRVPLRPAVGLTVLAVVVFYVVAAAYSAIFQPSGEQTVVEDLGAERSTLMLVASTLLVVGIAPFAEEFFFRGFFYGTLRTRLGVWPAAALAGLLFGAIHYSGPGTLSVLPPLAFLGFTFCILYERTGSLYPAIAFHAFNNAIAFSVEAEGAAAFAPAVGALAIGTCFMAASRQASGAPAPFGARQWAAIK